MSCTFNLEVKAEVNAQMSGGGMSDTAMALTIQMLTEKKIVAAMGQKAGVSASRGAMEAALKQGMERKMAEAAAKRAAEFAAKAATKAMAGPVGAVLMAAQAAGMVMEDATGLPSMPDCHAMPGTMDNEAPHLCRAHCSGDGQPAPSSYGVDLQPLAAHAAWIAYVLPTVIDALQVVDFRPRQAQPDSRAGAPPLYLTLQVLRN